MNKKTKRSSDLIEYAKSIGYSLQEIQSIPDAVAMIHGCGNPSALADLKEGEMVLDIGCGGGLDVFLAAQRVGLSGKVIGLDMSPEKIEKAGICARDNHYCNVEFIVAQMEKLPFPDDFVNVVISNCVINHAADKAAVFKEVYRVLKPGGRMFVSDLVTALNFTERDIRHIDKLWTDWLSAASGRQEYLDAIKKAGFPGIIVLTEDTFPMAQADPMLKGKIVSLQIKGIKE